MEIFVPEVPERDDDGREGEVEDTPELVFLAAGMVDLQVLHPTPYTLHPTP